MFPFDDVIIEKMSKLLTTLNFNGLPESVIGLAQFLKWHMKNEKKVCDNCITWEKCGKFDIKL